MSVKLNCASMDTANCVVSVSLCRQLIADYCEDIGPEFSELMERFREQAGRLIDLLDLSVPAVVRLKRLLNSLPVHALPDICAAVIKASHSERLEILDAVDLTERFEKTLPLLMRQIEVSLVLLSNEAIIDTDHRWYI